MPTRYIWLVLFVCALLLSSSEVAFAAVLTRGNVWLDRNGNGARDADEKGIARVPVYLRDVNDNFVVRASTTTNKKGKYAFKNVPPGVYVIQVVDPAEGWEFTAQGRDMLVDALTGWSAPMTLPATPKPRIKAGLRRVASARNNKRAEGIAATNATQVRCAAAIGPLALNWDDVNVSLPRFNVANAVLTNVSLTWSTVVSHEVSVTNNAANTGDITVNFTDNVSVTLPNGFVLGNVGNTQVAFDDVASGESRGPAFASVDEQGVYNYPAPLGAFVGVGNLNVSSDATAVFLGNGPGSLLINAESIGQATLCATYEYIVLVEPAELKNIVYDATNERLFVADRDNNATLVYDANTLNLTNDIGVGQRPFGMTLLNGRVYVVNFDSNSVSVINAATLAVLATIDLNAGPNCGTQPTHIAANPLTNKLYVALHGSGRVAVLDGASNSFLTCMDGVGGGTFGIAVNPALNRVYVTGRDSKDLRVIDGASDTQIASQRQDFGDSSPYQVAVDPNNDRVYVAVSLPVEHETVTRLYAYDADAGSLTPVAGSPFTIGNNHDGGGIGASPCSGKIYVLEPDNNTVRVFNGDLTLNAAHAQTDPFGLAFGDGKVFITNRAPATISVVADCP